MAEQRRDAAGGENGYAERIEHVEATRPEPWPGIRCRSREHEEDLPTGTTRDEQARVTQAQRRLEEDVEPPRH
ncbi:hypothetical protein DRW03_00840 [Corallococcus sp. H22C18031201]|uniref:hypothetical protein n=1 Tax=Citreicoccus inhibens TaxID=2849499 RepID=UPI000E717A9F|nr:hypothetical protein [Citreicoccus inhibens]MBU8898232.1 hypothetical protein [Citreicoccus inhibens]RJS26965.1 hypothetical protein DRW03_00840 [Corallococcus sp. H22C18031201]